nr:hypothetical protein CFP56_08223 [Quercus suber]
MFTGSDDGAALTTTAHSVTLNQPCSISPGGFGFEFRVAELLGSGLRIGVSLEDGGLRLITTDNDDLAMGMVDAVQGHKVIELCVEHCVDVPNIIDDVGNFTQSVAAIGGVGCDASFDDVFKGYDCDMDEGDDINISDNSKDSSGSDDDAFDKLI